MLQVLVPSLQMAFHWQRCDTTPDATRYFIFFALHQLHAASLALVPENSPWPGRVLREDDAGARIKRGDCHKWRRRRLESGRCADGALMGSRRATRRCHALRRCAWVELNNRMASGNGWLAIGRWFQRQRVGGRAGCFFGILLLLRALMLLRAR